MNDWEQMNISNKPVLLFKPDAQMQGMFPKREDPPRIPSGLVEQAKVRQAEKRDVIGLHEASLGKRSNETSGRAIFERKKSGDATTFAYHDNLARAIKQIGRVVGGMIPHVIAGPRILRILGLDGKEKLQPVNQTWEALNPNTKQMEQQKPIDLTIGKHDIVYMSGPGYATQRQEALDRLTQLMQYAPNVAAVIADVVVELMDIPGGEKVVKRLEALLPPAVRDAEGEGGQITKDQVMMMVQQAIEQYKQSEEGRREALKTEQQRLKVSQEMLQVEQERLKLLQGIGGAND